MPETKQYFVAVVGGAVAGSVAAEILADHGINVAVIEQNNRPYGKIEDGLPRWHAEQRKLEYGRIDARMKKPGVSFIPNTKLGRDVEFKDLCDNWGFSAVILANGAWRDRNLGLPGADQFIGSGLIYQNPFIYWFNHKNEATYSGPQYSAPDGALVVGGGLASIDVCKILQIENYQKALKARGIEVSLHDLERGGIPATCKKHGIEPEELGIKGCLMIYRRREQDMPLAQPPDNATPEQVAKTEGIRQKMLNLARSKYLFRVQDQRMPTGLIVENGKLVGLKVVETRVAGRSAEPVPGSEHELRASLVVSSIGSVPEMIPGVTMKGEYYTFKDDNLPQYTGCEHVFGVGNVVTGKGNINASLAHSREVTNRLMESYMGVGESASQGVRSDGASLMAAAEARGAAQANAVKDCIAALPALSDAEVSAIQQRIRSAQERVGHTADYDSWIQRNIPVDLE